jgi:hypothetical protein
MPHADKILQLSEVQVEIGTVVAICGMILDVLGAVILARSFVVKWPRDVFRELRSFGVWDFHISRGARDLVLSWLVQAVEARSGAFILFLGFLLQAIAQLLPQEPICCGGVVIAAGVCVAFGLFFFLQTRFVRYAARQAIVFYDELRPEAQGKEWKQEISLRREELHRIANDPVSWLRGEDTAPIDKTLTSE